MRALITDTIKVHLRSSAKAAYAVAPTSLILLVCLALTSTAAFGQAPPCSPQKAPVATENLLRYDLTITLDPPQHTMNVEGTIQVPASRIENGVLTLASSYFIEDFAPVIAPAQRDLKIEEVVIRDGKWDKLWDLHIGGAPIPPEGIALQIRYSLTDQIKPQFAVRPEGSLAGSSGDAWYPQLDYAISEVGRLTFRTLPGELVIAPGQRISTSEQEERGEFVFDLRHPAKFSFAAGPYTVKSSPDSAFTLFTLSNVPQVEIWFEKTAAAYAAMTEFYGPPPFGNMALVEVNFPTIILGTSERGFILADESQFKSFDFIYWAHEIAHQWWGGLVRAERNSLASTLFTEGVAEFTALLALEKVEGAAAAETYRKRGWSYKDRGLVPRYFEQVEKGADIALRRLAPKNQKEVLAAHRLSTSKVAFVISMLADLVGRDAVQKALRTLAENRAFGYASWADVEHAISQASGQDMEWFFEQWLGRPGAPDLQIRWNAEEGKVDGRILQAGPLFRLPLEVELQGRNGERQTERIWVEAPETPFVFEAPFDVRWVVLDPHFKILRRVLASDLLEGPDAVPGQ